MKLHQKTRITLFLACLSASSPALAITPQPAPGLLPTDRARPLLEQDPSVQAARAALVAGRAESRALHASPHDFTAKASGQQRKIDGSGDYNEWNVGIERGIRLPGKASADRKMGDVAEERAEAGVGEALHEAARALSGLWVNWLTAEHARELAFSSLQSFSGSLNAVEKRVRAGDASQLDLGTAKAELTEQRRQANEAKTAAEAAWARLVTRFPGVPRNVQPLPPAMPISADVAEWAQRIMEQSDELKLAFFDADYASAAAARAKADRIPDPSLGVFTASEFGGRERYTGLAVTIPFGMPGSYRSAVAKRAAANAEVSKHEAELQRRQFEAEIASAFVEARGAYDSWVIATDGAQAMADNAALMERAYTLGEAGLQDLLIARRQASASANSALEAHAVALKTYYTLVIDAHWVWDLEHE